MPIPRRTPPVWLMGLSNAPVGLYSGVVYFAIPQLLAARHVPEARIAAITAAAIAPNFWAVIFGPMLDVRFSRRFYATVFAGLAALLVGAAIFNLDHPGIIEGIVIAGTVASLLGSTALGGWLSTITEPDQKNALSSWLVAGYIAGNGVSSLLGGELARALPPWLAATLLGGLVFLPATIFLFMPAPGPDRRLASETFPQFAREIIALLKRREVLIALGLFLAPCGSFALTNLLGGVGSDFHASPRFVSLTGGFGGLVPGIFACLVFPAFARRIPLRLLYLAAGSIGAVFTLSLIVIPHNPWSFALALLGETFFATFANATQAGLEFETIGQNNPLAATAFTFLSAATQLPVTYMLIVDGRAYGRGGIAGSFATDAGLGIVACIFFAILFSRLGRSSVTAG
jgi:MFS transporter, PAT family, beta-lactamase induction signal transducer AmpG